VRKVNGNHINFALHFPIWHQISVFKRHFLHLALLNNISIESYMHTHSLTFQYFTKEQGIDDCWLLLHDRIWWGHTHIGYGWEHVAWYYITFLQYKYWSLCELYFLYKRKGFWCL